MTVEELVAMGYSKEVAESLLKVSGTASGASLPFPVLKLNYDLKDILSDSGVKKGEFISDWEIDNKNLAVRAEGKVLKQPLNFMLLASVYQCSHFDNETNKTDIITDIFFSPYDARKVKDNKSGQTVGQLKDAGKKVTFNNILLMLVKEGKEWNPFIFYSHGTHYAHWGESLAEAGVSDANKVLGTVYTVKSKKVPTNYNPAWVFDLVKAKEVSMEDRIKMIDIVSPISKKFNDFVEKYNSNDSTPTQSSKATTKVVQEEEDVDIDLDEDMDEIPF